MPVIIPKDLPAAETLQKEFIQVMHEERARTQDIRPNNALTRAFVGECNLTANDVAMGDADGVIFLPYDRLPELLAAAEAIHHTAITKVQAMRAGKTLYQQLKGE